VLRRLGGTEIEKTRINPLNAKLNPICHLLALLGTHHILRFSRVRVKQRMADCVKMQRLRKLLAALSLYNQNTEENLYARSTASGRTELGKLEDKN